MSSQAVTIISVAFWVFIAVVSVAGIIQDYRKRQLALEPLRLAIEHGQQLDPRIIDRLLGRDADADALDPRLLQVGGIVTCAAGLGLAVLSPFVAMVFPPYHWIVLGVGLLAACVGVGLIVAAKALRSTPPPRDNVA